MTAANPPSTEPPPGTPSPSSPSPGVTAPPGQCLENTGNVLAETLGTQKTYPPGVSINSWWLNDLGVFTLLEAVNKGIHTVNRISSQL